MFAFFHDPQRKLLIYESPPLPVLQHVDIENAGGKGTWGTADVVIPDLKKWIAGKLF